MKIENQHIKPDSPFFDNFLLLSAYPSLYLLLIHAVIRFPHILLKGFITIRVCYNITYTKLQGKWKFLLRRYLPGFLKDCRLSFLRRFRLIVYRYGYKFISAISNRNTAYSASACYGSCGTPYGFVSVLVTNKCHLYI